MAQYVFELGFPNTLRILVISTLNPNSLTSLWHSDAHTEQ
jgi:hypothetical protein